jgi:hypothetical protein
MISGRYGLRLHPQVEPTLVDPRIGTCSVDGPNKVYFPEDGDSPISETSCLYLIRTMDNVQEIRHLNNTQSSELLDLSFNEF